MNGPVFDLCAMSKFVHYAKYPHEKAIMNERLHYWGHFFTLGQRVKTNGTRL